MIITFDPIILLLEIYPKEIIWNLSNDLCIEIYTAELFIIEKLGTPNVQ